MRYLLGELTEEERDRVEEEYFTDAAAFERFLAARDELLDAHARGELDGGRRERFERHFLATRARRRSAAEAREFVEFATAASAAAKPPEGVEPQRAGGSRRDSFLVAWRARLRPLQVGLAAALILAILGGTWAIIRNLRTRPTEIARSVPDAPGVPQQQEPVTAHGRGTSGDGQQVPPAPSRTTGGKESTVGVTKPAAEGRAAGGARRTPSADREPGRTGPPAVSAQVASITLAPFLVRAGDAPNRLTLGPETNAVRLRLQVPPRRESFASFRAVLTTVGGEELKTFAGLRATTTRAGLLVTLNLDPNLLRRQDFIVRLDGVNEAGASAEVGEYYFRAVRGAADRPTPQPGRP
jgi:anti-sigma factor RsiW